MAAEQLVETNCRLCGYLCGLIAMCALGVCLPWNLIHPVIPTMNTSYAAVPAVRATRIAGPSRPYQLSAKTCRRTRWCDWQRVTWEQALDEIALACKPWQISMGLKHCQPASVVHIRLTGRCTVF